MFERTNERLCLSIETSFSIIMKPRRSINSCKSIFSLENLSREQKQAFETFNARVRETEPIKFRLKPQECLIIDNGRILHGRSSLSAESKRLLKRYWIGDSEFEKIE